MKEGSVAAALRSAGARDDAIVPDIIAHAQALADHGEHPLSAVERAAIMHLISERHTGLRDIEDIFGDDALANVYAGTARRDGRKASDEGREDQGSDEASQDAGDGEDVPRAEQAAGAAEDAEAPAVDDTSGDPEHPEAVEKAEGIAAYLRRIAAELIAVADQVEKEERSEAEPEEPDAGSRSAPIAVSHADDIGRAGERISDPSEAQAAAGNYRMAHVTFDGLDVTIETPKGAERRGKTEDGKEWVSIAPAAYGYIKRSTGADGDHVDAYLSDSAVPGRVFVIDQVDPSTRAFDEHKAVLGARSKNEARALYITSFSDASGPRRIGGITEMSTDQFKDWLANGDMKLPIRQQRAAA